jgi:hypothetical protein
MLWLLLFLSCVFVVSPAAGEDQQPPSPNITKEWKASVDDVLLRHHVVGLASTFNPDYLAQRDHIATLRAQTASLRGHVLFALLTCIDATLIVDVPSHYSHYAVQQVVADFTKNGFTVSKSQDGKTIVFSNLPPAKI